MKPEKLAKTMNDIIHDANKYYEFFKWQKYYTFQSQVGSPETDEICAFCNYLNERQRETFYKRRVYTNISKFWNSN